MVYVLVLVALILMNAVFAAGEMAVVTLNDAKLEQMAEQGHKKARKIAKLTSVPTNFLATIQVGVTISGLLSSAFAADRFAGSFATWLAQYVPLSMDALQIISLLLITILLTFVTLIFGELVPKRLAMHNPEKISFALAGFLSGVYAFTKPFVFLLAKTTNGIIRLFGIDPTQEPEEVTEEEIRMMVDQGNEKGSIEEMEREMINNVFEFNDITVEDVMTHRTDLIAVSVNDTLEEIIHEATEEGYSRLPVYEEDIDNIIGVLYVKDLLQLAGKLGPENFTVREYMRPALYVPESNKCRELFKELTAKKMQMAIVVDEYGGTSGVVTMEDLLESIVGNIQDEYDDEDEEFIQIGEHAYVIDGATDIEDVNDRLDLHIPESEDYDSLGGYMLSALGRIPMRGDHSVVTFEDTTFTILTVEDRRIEKVKAVRTIAEPVEQETETEE